MTNNVNQTDLLCFKGKIKNKLFSLNLNGKSNIKTFKKFIWKLKI